MGKILYKYLIINCILAVFLLASCTDNGYRSDNRENDREHKITFDIKRESEEFNTKSTERKYRGDEPGECRTDEDCVLIPIGESAEESCLGCFGGAGQDAEDKVEAKQIMNDNRATCEPVVKNFMEKMQDSQGQGQAPARSNDPTCQYNDAACVNGICKLIKRSEEEMRKKIEKMRPPQNANSMRIAPEIREPGHGFSFPRRRLETEVQPNFFNRRGVGSYPNPSIEVNHEREFPLYGSTAPNPRRKMVETDNDFWPKPY